MRPILAAIFKRERHRDATEPITAVLFRRTDNLRTIGAEMLTSARLFRHRCAKLVSLLLKVNLV